MTEPFHPDDELVNAVLDGEATPDERARVEGDPVLAARLAELRAVAGAVGRPTEPPSADARDRAIAAAIAERHRRDEVVRPLRPRRQPGPLLAVAAALLAVAVVAGLLVAGNDGGSEDMAGQESGDDAGVDSASGGEAAEPTENAAEEGDSAAAADRLGPVPDEEALRQTLAELGYIDEADDFAEAPATTLDQSQFGETEDAQVRGGGVECQIRLEEADPGLTGQLEQIPLEYAGTPAVVRLYTTADGDRQVIVVSADGCRLLASFLV